MATMATVAILAACSGGGSDRGSARSDRLLVEGTIGVAGGRLDVTTGADAGVAVEVPAGAVAVPTRFAIYLEIDYPEIPSAFPVYRCEPAAVDFTAAPLTVTVQVGDFAFAQLGGVTTALTIFTRPGDQGAWQIRDTAAGPTARTLTCTTSRLGRFAPWNPYLHRLFTQEFAVLDPARDTPVQRLQGTDIVLAGGTTSLRIGRGSLASFWNSPATDNVLILHGLTGNPLDFTGADDLIATLPPAIDNIVLLSYPSALGVTKAANALYDLIAAQRQPGFQCNLIAHSLGGLVARYLLEKSAEDPHRAGFAVGALPASTFVANLVMLGTPNAGADQAAAILRSLGDPSNARDRSFFAAADDLSEGPESFTAALNRDYVDNATVYHVLYGDLGAGTDGLVSVASALAVPLAPPESATAFVAEHNTLHVASGALGITAKIHQLLLP